MRIKLIFVFLALCGFLFTVPVFADDPVLISVPYTKQTSFKCGDTDIKIPPYFPNMDRMSLENLFLTAYENECKKDSFEIILGIGEDCGGQNMCIVGSFSSDILGEGVSSGLYAAFAAYTKEIELADDREAGFFAPSQCFAYCNEAQLIWMDRNQRINIIGYKGPNSQETIDQLVKAANSYINSD